MNSRYETFELEELEDKYAIYEQMYDPAWEDGALPHRKGVPHKPKKDVDEIISEIADETIGLEGGLTTTYVPSEYEAGWLIDSLRSFFDLEYITDITGQVKGGKEASVYRCTGHPITGHDILAAKVYRPRKFRNLRNDKMYREGRRTLKQNGGAVKSTDARLTKAMEQKSGFGVQVSHTSWLMHEFMTLERLYEAGAAVPKPFFASGNAILMEYIGAPLHAAPTLQGVRLERDEVWPLFRETMRNIELMLDHGLVHGDLSAFNILYWEGRITLIDFPQVTHLDENSNSRTILARDVQRICEYFQGQGVRCNPSKITSDLWYRYSRQDQDDQVADLSRWAEEV